ncbi:MAG TPA: motility protein A [Aquificales bacterium]|nr:motility protein A [Aquificales bacterium]
MDIATIVGLIAAWVLIALSIATSGGFAGFLNIPSLIIVVGGTLAALLIAYSLPDFIAGLKAFMKAIKPGIPPFEEEVAYIVNIAQKARKDGILSLENELPEYYAHDPFLGNAIKMIVDGADAETLEKVLDAMLENEERKWKLEIGFWDQFAAMAPAYGMIGTLIGLIQMLKNLNDPSTLGPAMAVALITTLYGALMANTIGSPIANKLKIYAERALLVKQLYAEGLLLILKGENPRVIEQKLAMLAGVQLSAE